MSAVPKPVRIWDEEYREYIRRCPCCVCQPGTRPTKTRGPLLMGSMRSDAAHVHGRGAGGDDVHSDEVSGSALGNIIPLCRMHHTKQHGINGGWGAIGLTYVEAAGLAWCYWVSFRVSPRPKFAF